MKYKILAMLLTIVITVGSVGQVSYAAEYESERVIREEREAIDIAPRVSSGDASETTTVQELDHFLNASGNDRNALFDDSETSGIASVVSYPIEITGNANTEFSTRWSFSAATPEVVTFLDHKGYLNVAYLDGKYLKIQRYGSDMSLIKQLKIPKSYSMWGNITCDDAGYYYVVWAQTDSDVTNCVTISVKKYDYQGKFIAECAYKGYDTWDSYWGSKYPFDAGNCSLTINNGVLAVNYSREMYSGHQSNYIIYVDCTTMTALDGEEAYCSHSFDQRIISLSDGGYLALNHGDAYDRGFVITKINTNRERVREICNFHFREGSNRSYGYNETYAQLGGIVETDNAYIFCGSSERTLSVETAPTNYYYCGYNEARDLFVQFFNKDLQYRVEGSTRTATGTKQDANSVYTELFLSGSEVDYGVVWLTDYEDTHFVANPKIVSIGGGQVAVLWEKRAYATYSNEGTYYAVLDEDGNVLKQPAQLVGVQLAGHIDPLYHNGKIYWATSDGNGDYIHALNPWMYSITYQLNGGENHSANPCEYSAETKTFRLKNPTRRGYTFAGWYEESNYRTKVTQILKGSTGDKILYAKWTRNKYNIEFEGNGATSGIMDSLTNLKYGTSYTLPSRTYKLTGYTFTGWNTKADGSGKDYANKASVKNLTATNGKTVTLYAQWEKDTYKITYKLGGGKNNKNNPATYTVTSNDITLKKPTRTGYTFAGWYSDSKYKTKVTQIKKGSTGKQTLYAKWTLNKYTIKFNGNGATSGKMSNLTNRKYGTSYKLTANAYQKRGYTFAGWNTKKNGKGKTYKNKASVKNLVSTNGGSVTLYAQWK